MEAFEAEGRGRFGEVPRFAVGHSFGGVLSSLILAKRPELFQRAVLLDPVLFSPAMIGVMSFAEVLGVHRKTSMAKRAAARRNRWPDRLAAYSALHGRGIYKGWTDVIQGELPEGWSGPFLVGTLAAAGSGLIAIEALLGYVRRHNYSIFVVYRLIAAAVILLIIATGVREATF